MDNVNIYFVAIIGVLCLVIVIMFLKMKKQKNTSSSKNEHMSSKQDVVVENMTQEMLELTQNLIKSHNIEMDTNQYAILNSASNLRELLKIKSNKIEIFYENFSFSHMLDDIAANMAPHFKSQDTELVFDLSDNVPMRLSADAVHLSRIINNILEFCISTTNHAQGVVTLKVWTSENKSILNLEIVDNSNGLKLEELHKMLNLIHDEDTGEHAGLALYIAKELSSQMGGRLEVNSKVGVGNRFLVAVPIEDAVGEFSDKKSLFSNNIEEKKVLIFNKKTETGLGLKRLLSTFYPQTTLVDSRDMNSHKVNFMDYDILILDSSYFNEENSAYLNVIKNKKSIVVISSSTLFATTKVLSDSIDKQILTPVTREKLVELISSIEEKQEVLKDSVEIVSDYKGSLLVHTDEIEETPDVTPASFNVFAGAKLLIVEDNLINQKILLGVLKSSGMKIDIANNGQEAVDFLLKEKRVYDMVLMDISMPVMDGETATKQIRKVASLNALPIVTFTAFVLGKEIEQMFLAGVNAYLTKPLNVKKLYTVFKMFLDDVQRDVKIEKIEKIDGLDIKKGIAWADDNEALYKETLKDFVSAYEETSTSIPRWIENKQYEHIKMVCRDMQSALGSIGAYELKAMIDEIQKQFVYNKEEFLVTYVTSYPKVLNKLISNIHKYLES